jgi:hypothetical protein
MYFSDQSPNGIERKRIKQQEYHAGNSLTSNLALIFVSKALDRDTKQRNSLHANEHEKLPSLYPPPLKGENQMRKYSLQPMPPSAVVGQNSNQHPQHLHSSDSKMNYLFDKMEQLISHVSSNDQRILQLEDFISRNPAGGAINGKVFLPFPPPPLPSSHIA